MMYASDISVDQFIELLGQEEYIAIDTESNGQDVRDGRGWGIGLSFGALHRGVLMYDYYPIRHAHGGNLDDADARRLKAAIEGYDGYLVFHNAKFDLVSLKTMGIDYKGKFYDTMLMAHLVNENYPFEKSLEACAKHYVKGIDGKKNKQDDIYQQALKVFGFDMPVEFIREYAAWDTAMTILLFFALKEKFDAEVSVDYWQHKQKLVRAIIQIEANGVVVDTDKCERMIAIGESIMQDIVDDLGLNPGSTKDLHELLIERMGLPVVKKTPAGKPSFDKFAMEVYEQILEMRGDEAAEKILAYRGWQKTVSSNYRAYLTLLSPDRRLRPNFKLHGTKTGRLSCEKPNLQQIPKSSSKDWNGDLKEAFLPTPGYRLYEADYSQLELRLATAYAKETQLMEVFAQGRDIFTEMSKTVGMERQQTKTLVYTMQYGGGINRLVQVFGVTPGVAADMRDTFFNTYSGFKRINNMAKNKCLSEGKVRIWSGRYRHFRDRQNEAHKAFNSIMQGGAADIVEDTMVRFHEQIVDENCRMLLQVHDSIWFEIKEGMEDEYFPRIEKLMTDIQDGAFGVTFAVDIHKIGE